MSDAVNVEKLKQLSVHIPNLVLIGGCATYAGSHPICTHDIDVIAQQWMKTMIANVVDNYSENTVHGGLKGSGMFNGTHIDVYYLYDSKLYGDLTLDVTPLADYATGEWEGFLLLCPEAMLVSKLPAVVGRKDKPQGEKDCLTILNLIQQNIDSALCWEIFARAIETDSPEKDWEMCSSVLQNLAPTSTDSETIRVFFRNAY